MRPATAQKVYPMSQWKEDAKTATRGTQFGAILYAAIGEKKDAPCFHGKGTITSDGYVMANFTGADGRTHMSAFVGSAADIVRNTKGLAEHLALNDEDRTELFANVRGWIATDYSNGALRGLEVKLNG